MKSVVLGTLAVLVVALAQATIQPRLVAPEMEEFVREQNERVGDDRRVWACDNDLIALLVAHCGENLRVRKEDVETWGESG
ncbi:unnamed protein product [Darwinula stevensoni]|uniref:Uncharacterized protein n=1 Tax=Darwinula stevensoni TaxID=69355 RepID=A0A7R8X8S9_9CRUS|nr:unnamed protein product [Darwinula stevensoni]CAG0888277.1 unnamed protein product [Darwinula stevensoni]